MKILVAGDFCPNYRTTEPINQENSRAIFDDKLVNLIQSEDYSLVNFETVVTTEGKAIEKCGPNLKTTKSALKVLSQIGFKGLTLANNHFFDYGEKGVIDTLAVCKDLGLGFVGAGMNLEHAAKPLSIKKDGSVVTFINCCEHEFSIASETQAGCNPLNAVQQFYAIKKAKQESDYVVVIVHGGNEYYQLPSPRMCETYRFFIDAGADVVINHHQHCYSGYEEYLGKPIFYGLGNFCFDWNGKKPNMWYEGYMVELVLDDGKIGYRLIPYVQCGEAPFVKLIEDDERSPFEQKIQELNIKIKDKSILQSEYDDFCKSRYNDMRLAVMPYSNRYLQALCNRKLIPSFLNKKRKLLLFNFISCESHKDVFLDFLKL